MPITTRHRCVCTEAGSAIDADEPDTTSSQCHFPSGHPGACLFDDAPPSDGAWDCGRCAYRNSRGVTACLCCTAPHE